MHGVRHPRSGFEKFWRTTPDWIELAVHGWWHPHPREAENWTREQTKFVFSYCNDLFVHGFKAPGWQISDATYEVAMESGLVDCRPLGQRRTTTQGTS